MKAGLGVQRLLLQPHSLGFGPGWPCICAFFFKESICIFVLTLYSIHITFPYSERGTRIITCMKRCQAGTQEKVLPH